MKKKNKAFLVSTSLNGFFFIIAYLLFDLKLIENNIKYKLIIVVILFFIEAIKSKIIEKIFEL